jgi:hypothetical protein
MTGLFTSTLFAAGLLATASFAQAVTPGSENTQAPGFHNNMMPVKRLPVRHHRRPAHKPASTASTGTPSNSAASSSKPASTASSTASPSTANAQNATPANPDQGKPGTLTRPQGNTTTTHMPGSENSQDQGPTGAPKT